MKSSKLGSTTPLGWIDHLGVRPGTRPAGASPLWISIRADAAYMFFAIVCRLSQLTRPLAASRPIFGEIERAVARVTVFMGTGHSRQNCFISACQGSSSQCGLAIFAVRSNLAAVQPMYIE
jgi:hypothetical protein